MDGLGLSLLELLITAESVLRCFKKQKLVNANPFHCLKSQSENALQKNKENMLKKQNMVDTRTHRWTDAWRE